MRRFELFLGLVLLVHGCGGRTRGPTAAVDGARHRTVAPAANGLELPVDYRDWPVLAVSRRDDHGSLRAILGNDVALAASRAGTPGPWPEGSILAKVVWKDASSDDWPAARVPETFVHVEIMVKDSARFPEYGGWGFARWLGEDLRPHATDPDAALECLSCHEPVADRDYVFTRPVLLP